MAGVRRPPHRHPAGRRSAPPLIQHGPAIYQWTEDDDEVASDATTVGIGRDMAVLEKLGLTVQDTVASIYWPDWITQGDKVLSAMEGPYSAPDALERAETLCALWAFEPVVISLQDRSLWCEQWGTLAEFPGYD